METQADQFARDSFCTSVSILYVEDDLSIRKAVLQLLNRRYMDVYTAEDGEEGLRLYREKRPDIIVTDIQMPVMTGLEMISEIRKEDRETPIIVTSAHNNAEYLFEAIEMKVDNFLLKPINVGEFLERVERCARRVHLNAVYKIFKLVAEQMSKGLMLINVEGDIEYANPAFSESSGYMKAELVGQAFVNDEEPLSPYQVESRVLTQLYKGEELTEVTLRRRKTGETYYQNRTITPIKNEHDHITHFVFLSHDATREQMKIRTLEVEAHHDSLTGLLRRNVLENRFDEILAKSDKIVFALLDIDLFKSINDTLGHDIGDKVLQKFARIVSSNLRSEDLFFRWGGEEFLILFQEQTVGNVYAIMERTRKHVAEESFDIDRTVTVSIGLARYEPGEAWLETLKRADEALYSAKTEGRNRTLGLT